MFGLARLKRLSKQFPSVGAVIVLAGVMALGTVISATALLLDLRRAELDHARGEIITLTGVLSEQTTRTFEGVSLTLRNVKERLSDDIGRRLALDSLPVRLLLQARSAGLAQVKSIFVVDGSGLGVNSSRPDFIPRLDVSRRAYFRHFADGGDGEIYIGRPEKAGVDGQWTFYVSTRLSDAAGQFRGVLVAAINIVHFETIFESAKLDFVSRIQLLDLDGFLMAGKPGDDRDLGGRSAQSAGAPDLRALPQGRSVERNERFSDGLRLVAYRRTGGFPLAMRVAVDQDEALTPWRRVMRPIVAGASVMLAFVLGTALLLARNLMRKGALETELKESDDKLRHTVHSVNDGIVTLDSNGVVLLFNRSAELLFGVAADAAIGKDIGALLTHCAEPEQRARIAEFLETCCRSATCQAPMGTFELAPDGHHIPVEVSLSCATFRGERLLTAVFRDLTERRRAERELMESGRQVQSLSASLQNYREEERARIARELHDELGQLLTGIRLEVSWLAGRLAPEQEWLAGKVNSVKGQIDQTIATVRRIASELRPLVLDDLGFAAAAAWYVDQFSARTGLPVDLSLPSVEPPRGDAVATALFRVLQESLTNIARHAKASRAQVSLACGNGEWTLRIIDDGVGFAPQANGGSIGLAGMRERAQNLGGRFAVVSLFGKGTTVEAVIPAARTQEVGSWKS